ncbi:MAG: hypothetical protein AAGB46_15120 [Verrucomicrobiota bacterium]
MDRYERGIDANRFQYFPGKDKADLERALRDGDLRSIRLEILYPVAYEAPEIAEESAVLNASLEVADLPIEAVEEEIELNPWSEGGFEDEKSDDSAWGLDVESGWVEQSSRDKSNLLGSLMSQIQDAVNSCNYGLVKELADSILKVDGENEWVVGHYEQIVEWADRAAVYRAALSDAYAAYESEDYDVLVTKLEVAYENAASNCGQDTVVSALLNQANEAKGRERDEAIALAKQEGLINQQSFVESQRAQAALTAGKQKGKGGLGSGLRGLLGAAVKVAVMKDSGMSTDDALMQTLQQQTLTSNPDLGQTIGQLQQLQGMDAGVQNVNTNALGNLGSLGNASSLQQMGLGNDANDWVSILNQATQLAQNSGSTQAGNSALQGMMQAQSDNGAASTGVGDLSNMSPQCRQMYQELQQHGKEMQPLAERYIALGQSGGASTAELQSMAARIQMMAQRQQEMLAKIKAAGCPGSEDIPNFQGLY